MPSTPTFKLASAAFSFSLAWRSIRWVCCISVPHEVFVIPPFNFIFPSLLFSIPYVYSNSSSSFSSIKVIYMSPCTCADGFSSPSCSPARYRSLTLSLSNHELCSTRNDWRSVSDELDKASYPSSGDRLLSALRMPKYHPRRFNRAASIRERGGNDPGNETFPAEKFLLVNGDERLTNRINWVEVLIEQTIRLV